MDDADYEVHTSTIPPHSRLLIYSDGLAEAFPPNDGQGHREFGQEGLLRTMDESRDLQLPAAMQRLFDASSEFTGGQGRHDDTSVVLAERNGAKPRTV